MHSRSRTLAGFLLLAMGLTTLVGAQTDKSTTRVDLSGTVRDLAKQPISNAIVSIFGMRPKEDGGIGSNSTDDCRKQATTGADGKFTIKSLDTNATFTILVVAKGFRLGFLNGVNPSFLRPGIWGYRPEFRWGVDTNANTIDVTLVPESSDTRPENQVRGRVLDSGGKPVVGAMIHVTSAEANGFYSSPPEVGIDPFVLTDESGVFVVHGQSNFISCNLEVEARGFAPSGETAELSTGSTVHEVRLTEGAYLKGRLLKDGKPVANAGIGISSVKYAGGPDFSVVTDGEGRFSFANIYPDTEYYLYGIMRSLKDRGTLSVRQVQAGADGSIQDVGDLNLEPAYTVTGTLRWRDGKPAPANTLIDLVRMVPPFTRMRSREFPNGRDFSLDHWTINPIGKEAHFQFSGVPAGTVSIYIKGPVGHLSPRNVSGDPAGYRLMGRVTTNKTDLVFEIEPGQMQGKPEPVDYQALSQKPLRGAE